MKKTAKKLLHIPTVFSQCQTSDSFSHWKTGTELLLTAMGEVQEYTMQSVYSNTWELQKIPSSFHIYCLNTKK